MARKQNKADASASKATPAAAAETQAATPANFDTELDAFFKAAPPAPAPAVTTTPAAAGPSNPKKRKAAAREEEAAEDSESEDAFDNEDEEEDEEDDDVEMEEGDGDLSSIDEELDDEGSLLFSQSEDEGSDKDDNEDEDDNEPYVPPQHESVTKGTAATESSQQQRKKTFKEEHEPSELRDQRTLFIGNVPIETAQSRSLQRKLVSFIESFSPYPILTKATGLRFRSVAFSVPTVHFDADDDDADDKKKKKKGKAKERSQNYREAVAAVEGGENAQAPLTAQQKRKIAFINKEFHEKAKSVSAYVTIAHPKAVLQHLYDIVPPKSKAKSAADKPSAPIELDPRLTGSVLAALIASFADGQPFQGRHLRIDLVKSISPSEVLSSGLEKVKTFDGSLAGSSNSTTDPKSTLFVGGLDFETDEEEVRAFFESLLTEEIGSPGDAVTIPITGLDGQPAPQELLDSLAREFPFVPPEQRKVMDSVVRDAEHVRSVRLIRDAATQMGKGIGYVRFASAQCVDEVMAIYNAEQAFLESIKGVKGSLGASAAIAAGGKEFKRRLKLGGRPIRIAYCKSQTKSSSSSRGAGRAEERKGEEPPATPKRKYERSSGAPTPNGTSPHALAKKPRTATKVVPGIPSTRKTVDAGEIAKKAELYATLSKDQRKQMKKDDADRVSRRMDKKNRKLGNAKGKGFKADKSLLAEGEKHKSKEKVKLKQPTAGGASGAGAAAKGFKSGHGAKRK